MKKMISLSLALCFLLALAIQAGATSIKNDLSPEELYQEYLAVVDRVSQESGVEISVCPLDEMDRNNMDSLDEFTADVYDLRDTVLSINTSNTLEESTGTIQPFASYTNPSGKGAGDKYVNLNKSGGQNAPYFVFNFYAHFYVAGSNNNFWIKQGPDQISITRVRGPVDYDSIAVGSPKISTSTSGTTVNKKVTQRFDIMKDGTLTAIAYPYVVYSLETTTGVITGRAH